MSHPASKGTETGSSKQKYRQGKGCKQGRRELARGGKAERKAQGIEAGASNGVQAGYARGRVAGRGGLELSEHQEGTPNNQNKQIDAAMSC